MAELTYNEARSIIDATRAENDAALARTQSLASVFNRVTDVLIKAEEAESAMRTLGPQTTKAKNDNKAALSALRETEAQLKLRNTELDDLNKSAVAQDRQRKEDAAKAIRAVEAEYEDRKKSLMAEFDRQQKSFDQAVELLRKQRADAQADLAATKETLAEVTAQVNELKSRAEKARSLFSQ
jgi:chromosome segregation ATPase